VFERLLGAGELPEIRRHVVERGSYRRASSTFTSTTGPAHLPFLTGCYPGTANLVGYRWFDRGRYRPGLPLGPWCIRTYTGPEAWLQNRDLSPDVSTLFELTHNPVNVFGVVARGVTRRNSLARFRKTRLWLRAHYREDYDSPDETATQAMEHAIGMPSEFAFVVFPGIDWNSHYISPFATETEAAYRRVDRAVGRAAEALRRAGKYESTLLIVCSDHGHCPVERHFDLPVRLEEDHGLRVGYHSGRLAVRSPQLVVCVSGNGMSHVYALPEQGRPERADRAAFDAIAPGVRERLVAEEAVDLVMTRENGELLVESARGRALLSEAGGRIRYRPETGDPFGYGPLPEHMDLREALELTFRSGHPDGLLQAAQIFRAPRCGDLVVSARPRFDLRERYERPPHLSSHGALHQEHMHVPLAMSAPLAEGPLRTADVFPSVLAWLQRALPDVVDGVGRLAAGVSAEPVSVAADARDRRSSVGPP
jgi:hypothetical protein